MATKPEPQPQPEEEQPVNNLAIVPRDNPAGLDMKSMSVAELKNALLESIGWTVACLTRAAYLLRELDDQKVEVPEVPEDHKNMLRRVLAGQLLAEVMIAFGDYKALLPKIQALEITDQRNLAEGKGVPVWFLSPNERPPTYSMIKPIHLTKEQIKQVFFRGRIRNQTEQILWLRDQQSKSVRVIPDELDGVQLDEVLMGIWIGKVFVPLHLLVRIVKLLQGKK